MKEAWEVMGEHWAVTLFVGIVIVGSFNRITIVIRSRNNGQNEKANP